MPKAALLNHPLRHGAGVRADGGGAERLPRGGLAEAHDAGVRRSRIPYLPFTGDIPYRAFRGRQKYFWRPVKSAYETFPVKLHFGYFGDRLMHVIGVLFTVELVLRFAIAPKRRKFFSNMYNVWDFLAVLPFWMKGVWGVSIVCGFGVYGYRAHASQSIPCLYVAVLQSSL